MTETTPSSPTNPEGSESRRAFNPITTYPITSAAIFVLVFGAIFCTLYVPIYASTTPKVGSWPFFYFYCLIYMPITAVVLYLAMLLQRRLKPRAESEVR